MARPSLNLKQRSYAKFILAAAVSLVGCAPPLPPGGDLRVQGTPGDVVTVQRAEPVHAGVCCFPIDGCADFATVRLNMFGVAWATHMVDNIRYTALSPFTGCIGIATLPCAGEATLICQPAIVTIVLGRLIIEGPGVECQETCSEPECFRRRQICNNTRIWVNINGTTISALAIAGTTASSLAQQIASRINSDPALSAIVVATVSANVVTVHARNAGVEYAYPWMTSCSYNHLYFPECAFEAVRAPVSTLEVQEQ